MRSLPSSSSSVWTWAGLGLFGWWLLSRSARSVAPPPSLHDSPVAPPPASQPFEYGVASWYGGTYHGRQTANGETFDMYAMTAAHRTLKFGTIVDVRDVDTGKSVRVRINDRGPFTKNAAGQYNRVIDLSMAAAEALGSKTKGLANVELRLV